MLARGTSPVLLALLTACAGSDGPGLPEPPPGCRRPCVATLAPGASPFAAPRAVAIAPDGRVHVTTGDTVAVIAGDAVTTLAGGGAGFTDGLASQARFRTPAAVALQGDEVFIADSGNHRIRLIASGKVTTVTGNGKAGPPKDAAAAWAVLSRPRGLAITSWGKIYFTGGGQLVRAISDGFVFTVAGVAERAGFADGAAGAARFRDPAALAVDARGRIYVADTGNHRIRLVDDDDDLVSTLAGDGQAGFADGPAKKARFRSPAGIVVDARGRIYVADTGNHRIRVIADGKVTTIAGGAAGYRDGPASAARFRSPAGIAVDGRGTLYVADSGNRRVRAIFP